MVKHRFIRVLITGPLLLACAAPLAGCGGSAPPAKSVAALSSATASASASPTSSQSAYQGALAYSQCMRSHGVANFPDPTVQDGGGVGFQLGSGIDPNSAQFKAAHQACQSLEQGGKQNGQPFDPTKIPAWVDCVRKHGVPSFPYPTNTGTGMQLNLTAPIDQSTLQKALNTCKPIAPGGTLQISAGSGLKPTGGS
jgi:hypothetical protein